MNFETLAILTLGSRLDWGLGNPNKTAALIATLMIAVWVIAFIWRKGFWLSLAAFGGLGFCLLLTLSRGGVVALLAGSIPLFAFSPRPWPRGRVIAVVAVLLALIAAAVSIERSDRFTKGISEPDASISNRLLIWKKVPKMMVDAPGGWGLGNSGNAYMQWYQPTERTEGYRTLVSSHLTWLVELGWWGRFWYLFGWTGVFALCWPRGNRRWFSVITGVWITFSVAAAFSSVAESTWLWGMPGLLLLLAIVSHIRNQTWPGWRTSAGIAAISGTVLAGILFVGILDRPSPTLADHIHFANGRLTIGARSPKIWVLPDHDVMGRDYGKDIRRSLNEHIIDAEPIGFVSSASNLPHQEAMIVVAGGTGRELGYLKKRIQNGGRLHLINPAFSPGELGVPEPEKVHVFFGEFSQSPAIFAWRKVTTSLTELPGTTDYCPSWATLIFREKHE